MCLETIRNHLGLTPVGKPSNTQPITANEILQIIAGNAGVYPTAKFYDAEYKTTTFADYDRFIRHSMVDLMTYENEFMDCDDFAIALWGEFTRTKYWSGLAFGAISVTYDNQEGAHALNIMITNDHTAYYVEPQNDKKWLMESEKHMIPYFVIM